MDKIIRFISAYNIIWGIAFLAVTLQVLAELEVKGLVAYWYCEFCGTRNRESIITYLFRSKCEVCDMKRTGKF